MNILKNLNWNFLFLATGIFLAGLGAKWELIETQGIDLATKDAWGGHAKQTILPWLKGNLDYWENFWQPWNNHHIGFPRLWAIGMTFISGHWDNQFSCTFSSLIPCITACFLLFIFRKLINGIGIFLIPLTILAGLCFPNGYENTVESFQVQFYLGIVSTLAAIIFMNYDKHSQIFLGFLSLLFSTSCIASTPILISSLFITICLSIFFRKSIDSKDILKFLFLITATIHSLNLLMETGGVENVHQADSVTEFLLRIFEMLSYPFASQSVVWNLVLSTLIMCPSIVFVLLILRSKKKLDDFIVRVNFSLLIFSFCFIIALSYSRCKLGIPSRYADISNLFLLANAICSSFLCLKASSSVKPYIQFFSILWLSFILYGFAINPYGKKYFEAKRNYWDRNIIINTQNYIDSNGKSFERKQKLPNDKETHLQNILLDKDFSQILPPSVRKPLPTFQGIKSTSLNYPLPFNYDENLYQRDYLFLSSKSSTVSFLSPKLTHNPSYSFLRFYFCGSPDLKSSCLSIFTDKNISIPINTSPPSDETWKTANVYIPNETKYFIVKSITLEGKQWLAFREPVEVSLPSWIGRKLRKAGGTMFSVGLIFLIAYIAWKYRNIL